MKKIGVCFTQGADSGVDKPAQWEIPTVPSRLCFTDKGQMNTDL